MRADQPQSLQQTFISMTRYRQFFVAALVGGLLSRVGIFLTGYSSDDFRSALIPPDEVVRSIRQGRVLASAVWEMLARSGFTQPSIQLPLFLISLFALAALIAKAFDMALLPGRTNLLATAGAAICATYPYLTSYYLYRMVILDQIIIYLIVLAALAVISSPRLALGRKILFAGLIIGFGTADNQLVLILYGIFGLAYFVATALQCPFMRHAASANSSTRVRDLFVVPSTLILGLAIYVPITKFVQKATAIAPESGYSIGSSGLLQSLINWPKLIRYVLVSGDPIVPSYMKILMILLLVIIIFFTLCRSWRATVALVLFVLSTLAISVAPMAVTWGGHVARIFMGVGFSLGLFICLGSNFVTRPFWPAVLAIFLALLYSFSGAAMFYQQHLLSQWDIYRARGIYINIAQLYDINSNTRIKLVNGSTFVNEALTTHGSENAVNESALRHDWGYAYPGLFLVATGKTLDVQNGDPALCSGKPSWPREGSIFSMKKDVINVCL